MTFLNPWMLLGLAAIGVPVLVHLFSKPRLKRIQWAATRFLQASIEKNRRRLQVEDLLLLLIRCLLVILLVLIFTRPALMVKPENLLLSGDKTTAVILLDQSASMGQSDGAKTRFEQAKAAVQETLGKLAAGSSCALFLVGEQSKPVIAKPTRDFALIRRVLDNATVSDYASDLYPGIKDAIDTLTTVAGRREVFIFTDSQAAAWRQLGNIRKLQELHKDSIQLRFFIIGASGEDNVAVTSLKLAGSVAAVNQPVRCVVEVANFGKSAVEQVPVKIAVDGDAPQDETMISRIEPGETRSVNLFVRIRHAGYHAISANIPGDRQPSDNQRSVSLLVLEQMKVLVVDGTAEGDGFFLRNALVPVAPGQAAHYYMQAVAGRPGDLESAGLKQYDFIFLCNVAELSSLAAQNLRQYVTQGGNLAVFPGAACKLAFYNNDPNFGALLPAKLEAARNGPEPQKFLAWQAKDYAHPVVDLWNDPESGTLDSVRVTQYYPLTMKDADGATVLKYTNNEVAVAERSAGQGRVFLFGIPARTDWSNLPVNPAFVPLITRMVAYSASMLGSNLNLAPGQPFAFEVESEYAGQDVSVQRIGKDKRQIVGRVEQGEKSAWISYRDTELSGAYAVYLGGDKVPKVVFAVQSDPAESNLQQQNPADIEPLLQVAEPEARQVANDEVSAKAKVPGPELWFYLALALLLAVLETFFAHVFSREK